MNWVNKWILFLLVFSMGTTGFSGVRITVKETRYSPYEAPEPETTVVHIQGQQLRMDFEEDNGAFSYIYIQPRNIVYLIDHQRKAFTVVTEEALQQIAGQMKSAMEEMQQKMQEQLQLLSPDQREMIEKMMKEQMPQSGHPPRPEVTLKKVASGEKIGKWICDRWEIYKNGEKTEDLWTTDASQLLMGKQIIQLLQGFSGFWITGFKEFMGDEPGIEWFSPDFQKKLNGFPVASITYENGQKSAHWELLSIQQQSFPTSYFQAPHQYQQVPLEDLWQMKDSP